MGMAKAAVLPVPVRAWPRKSPPASALGMSKVWISEGVSNFASASPRRMEERTPNAAKACGRGGCSALSVNVQNLHWHLGHLGTSLELHGHVRRLTRTAIPILSANCSDETK